MWLITSSFMAVIATAIWYISDDSERYKLDVLALIFWGATVMVFVDHLMGYISYGTFFDVSIDALLLGIVMVIVGLFLWEIWLIINDPKGKIWKKIKAPLS